jgi:glucose/arabinose dehydrogenase
MKAFYLFLTVCLSAAPCLAAPTLVDPNLKVEVLVSGLDSPTTMAFIAPGDILVLQKNDGKVRRVIDGVLQAGEVLDLNVDNSAERGLLGIALHPDFATNHFVYLYYTEGGGTGDTTGAPGDPDPLGNRVYRYTWDDSALISPSLIADLPVIAGPNHDGGIIVFGPDDKLYVVIGDLNRNGQLQNFSLGPAPDNTSVILRLNVDGSIPTDNPFFSSGDPTNLKGKYYAYGVRNSFGMAFDPVTGKLWDTENGENTFDEINLVEPGFNSGWESIMGPDSRDPQNATGDLFVIPGSHYADPKFSWLDTVGPTAIVFLASTALGTQYKNDVFVGDVNNGNLYHFQPNANRDGFIFTSPALVDLVADNNGSELDEVIFGTGFNGIVDLKVGPDDLLYVVSIGDGAIYRISPSGNTPPLFFSASSLPDGEADLNYNADLGIGGGTAPYIVTIVKGSLPSGLTADSDGINGMPSPTKKSVFLLQVTDQAGASITKQFKMKVFSALTIATTTLKNGTVGKKYKGKLTAQGGKPPYNWSLTSGVLPSGLVFNPISGSITGTPTAAGSPSLTFAVTDALGGTDQQTLMLTIN